MLKKNLFMLLLSITMLSAKCYAAENIVIEGEAPADGTKYSIQTNAAASGGKYLSVQYSALNKESYRISYNAEVTDAGWYDLIAECTRPSYEHCSDFKVSVNGGDAFYASRRAEEKTPTYMTGTHMARLDFGGVYLKKGTNTIELTVDERVASTYNGVQVCFYLDRLELTPAESFVRAIEPGKPNGIFEESDKILFKALMNAPGDAAAAISYKITDYTQSVKKQGSFSVAAGESEASLTLDLDVGWYNAEFTYEGKTKSVDFCIVHDSSSRGKSENSPFALDVAANWEVLSYADKVDYARAARLLGIGWVRDRFDWSHMYKSGTEYKFYPWNEDSINVFSDEGLKILEVFHSNPSVYSQSGDLRDIYETTKAAAKHYKGKVAAWEIWNEPDISFGTVSAEEYSAYFKAAALGVEDSGADAYKLNAGMAERPVSRGDDCSFFELALRNGIMRYSDAYTYHTYGYSDMDSADAGITSRDNANFAAHKAYAEDKPMWVSEGGYGFYSTSSALSAAEQLTNARALVRVLSDSVAKGNDKHFWFILGQRQESTKRHFGMLNGNNEPNIAYSVYSNLTYQLGGASYKGEMLTTGSDVHGSLFTDGKKDIAVMWSATDGTQYTISNAEYVRIVDMVGNESVKRGVNGSLSVTLSKNPVYIIFEDGCSERNYYRQEAAVQNIENGKIAAADRIVIRQKPESGTASKNYGYEVGTGGVQVVAEVYNFSDKAVTGTLSAETEGNFAVSDAGEELTIPAGGKETISMTLTKSAEGASNKGYLILSGSFNGSTVSPSVARLTARDTSIIDSCEPSDWKDASAWDTAASIVRGGTATASTTESGVKFDVTFSGGDQYAYPLYTLSSEDKEKIKSMTGVTFDFTTDMASGTVNMILGGSLMTPIPAASGTQTVTIPFSSLTADVKNADLSALGIGINTSASKCSFTIENLRFYDDGTEYTNAEITLSGIENGVIYEKSDFNIGITVPTDGKDTFALLNGEEVKISGNSVALKGLGTGKYELLVGTKMPNCETIYKKAEFYVQLLSDETELLFRREAEKADGGSLKVTDGGSYSGGSAAEITSDKTSERLTYIICLPTDGRYELTLNAPRTTDCGCKIYANGKALDTSAADGSFSASAELSSGENTVEILLSGENGIDFVADFIDVKRYLYDERPYVKLEGENYSEGSLVTKLSQSWNASELDFSNLSGQNGLKLEASKGSDPYAAYSINVPKAGNYSLRFTSTPLNKTTSYCKISLTVGDNTLNLSTSNCTRADNSEFECDAVFYNYNYNSTVHLEKGVNRIVVKPTSARLNTKRDYYLLLDDIEFTFADDTENTVWTNRNYLPEGDTAQIYVRSGASGATAEFKSLDTGIARVDELGKITAVGIGKTAISVTLGESEVEIPVTVYGKESGVVPLGFTGGSLKIGGFADSQLNAYAAKYSKNDDKMFEAVHSGDTISEGEVFELKINSPVAGEYAKGFLWSDDMTPLFPAVLAKGYARLEGESFTEKSSVMKLTQSWNASSLDFSLLSGGNGLKLEGSSTAEPYAVYEVNVPNSGEYSVRLVSTPLDNTLNYCNMKLETNDESYILSADTAIRADEWEIKSDAVMYGYSLKSKIHLNEGVNRIKLSPTAARSSDSTYYFLLDYIEFTEE